MKISLVLSGGAVRGLAHIGVLKALEEENIEIEAISGVSAGAIIGSLYASGYKANQLEEIALKENFLKWFKPSKTFKSLFSLENLERFLKNHIKEEKIENLPTKLFVTTTDLNYGKFRIWEKGNLYKIVRASSSIPFFFEPVEIDGRQHVDGGVTNNLPVEPFIGRADFIIAVDVNPIEKSENLNNIFSITLRSFNISISAYIEFRKKYADIFLQPKKLSEIGLFDIRKRKEPIEIGYLEMKKVIKAIIH
ncbi:patatin-like phospholipase family protein [Hydrogenothermus marinus]|uniref:NTE family protein n=1 Tax=Hydrogenothermus marinus TaxID=133270 RepID=A0A3M0BNC5_9AQUI|nr:patatin-like phospholipase family protein [Hydrogenothermus marinus]RMA97789.1 NTE family protein [Hydrogenothermus marinus]